MEAPVPIDEDGLTGLQVTHQPEAQALQRHRFRRHQVLGTAVLGLGHAVAERPDAQRITEGQQPVAGDLGHTGIGATRPAMQRRHRLEDGVRIQRHAPRPVVQLVRQHVQQHFGIGVGVDMPAVALEELLLERLGVGEVAVVGQGDPERGIHIEGLRLFLTHGRTRRGVADMANARTARQRPHVAGAKDVPHQPAALVNREGAAAAGADTGCVLSPMLQKQQSVIQQLVGRRLPDQAQDSAHDDAPLEEEKPDSHKPMALAGRGFTAGAGTAPSI